MRKTRIIIALATVGLFAVAASQARPLKPEEEAKITPVGKPEHCIRLDQLDESRVRDDQTIDFYMRGGRVYRNRLPNSCPSLGFEERFSHRTSIQELCSSDVITVLQSPPVVRGASCGLGDFQEVTGAPRGH
jgi:hypothetical protein